ncbi:hypothetical protein AWB91_09620 [Mycobacterium paraense]|uniref:Cupin 2 conserved barrel domain-containing protein n=1 Tax=Mycobacterium paraense TaxID=767916 RepID=A0ABX3VR36_9MYCO|nr:hypothetical protein AWB91_09620 [Mycobacterium paraense]ORW44964.1 hypothetical protein AWB88_04690 [Mycobacterium paraense]
MYALLEGEATIVDLARDERQEISTGAMIHLDPLTPYAFIAGEHGAVILGGPCPPDFALYSTG